VIDSQAKLGEGVRVGAYAVIEGPVVIGAGSDIQSHARVVGNVTMGARNMVHGGATIGDLPQDRKYHGEFSEVVIGDENLFREGVTVHRGTGENTKTVIGSRCFLMVNSHVGHNCVVGDDVMMVNGATLGGFVQVGDRAIIGAYSSVHQFCRVGRMAMITNIAGLNVDLPPFVVSMGTNQITQLNLVGLRRSGMPREHVTALRQMFKLLFRTRRLLGPACEELPGELTAVPEVREFVAFCKGSKRGVARYRAWSSRALGTGETEGE